jgi:hypothetical protein
MLSVLLAPIRLRIKTFVYIKMSLRHQIARTPDSTEKL